MSILSDADIRRLWREAGGEFHGPIVETATMPEEKLFWFVRDLVKAVAVQTVQEVLRPQSTSKGQP